MQKRAFVLGLSKGSCRPSWSLDCVPRPVIFHNKVPCTFPIVKRKASSCLWESSAILILPIFLHWFPSPLYWYSKPLNWLFFQLPSLVLEISFNLFSMNRETCFLCVPPNFPMFNRRFRTKIEVFICLPTPRIGVVSLRILNNFECIRELKKKIKAHKTCTEF